MVLTIAVIVFVLLLTLLVCLFNQLTRLRNTAANALAQIDVQLKRRYELIPNLVEVARKYLTHEAATLEAVIAARNQADAARLRLQAQHADSAAATTLMGAESVLQGGLGRLFAVAEAYPALKADATLRDLGEELTHTENRVSYARQAYNDDVLMFNNAAASFPGNVVAGLFNFKPLPMLQSTTTDEERAPVRVHFSGP